MDLPVVKCPAAVALAGPAATGPSIVCAAMRDERYRTDQILHGTSKAILIEAAKKPNVVFGFCCGTGIPVDEKIPSNGRGHYTACPIWRLEKERIAERRAMLAEPKRRGSTTPFGLPIPDGQTPGDQAFDPERILEVSEELAESVKKKKR